MQHTLKEPKNFKEDPEFHKSTQKTAITQSLMMFWITYCPESLFKENDNKMRAKLGLPSEYIDSDSESASSGP